MLAVSCHRGVDHQSGGGCWSLKKKYWFLAHPTVICNSVPVASSLMERCSGWMEADVSCSWGYSQLSWKHPQTTKSSLQKGKAFAKHGLYLKQFFFFHLFSLGSWLYLILDSHICLHSDIFDVFSIWTLGFFYWSSFLSKDLLRFDSFLTHNCFSKCQQFLWLRRQVKYF